MSHIEDYKILRARGLDDLEALVKDHLNKGWELVGELIISDYLYREMVKLKPAPVELLQETTI
jgi:hypothetical protein